MTGTVAGRRLRAALAWSWFGQGSLARLNGRLTTRVPIVASRAVSLKPRSGMSGLAEKTEAPGYMGSPYVREAVEDWLAYLGVERQLAGQYGRSL